MSNSFYIGFKVSFATLLKIPSRLSRSKDNLFGSKPASRDVEEVLGENLYVLLGYH
jgi:hypothetical protein